MAFAAACTACIQAHATDLHVALKAECMAHEVHGTSVYIPHIIDDEQQRGVAAQHLSHTWLWWDTSAPESIHVLHRGIDSATGVMQGGTSPVAC